MQSPRLRRQQYLSLLCCQNVFRRALPRKCDLRTSCRHDASRACSRLEFPWSFASIHLDPSLAPLNVASCLDSPAALRTPTTAEAHQNKHLPLPRPAAAQGVRGGSRPARLCPRVKHRAPRCAAARPRQRDAMLVDSFVVDSPNVRYDDEHITAVYEYVT